VIFTACKRVYLNAERAVLHQKPIDLLYLWGVDRGDLTPSFAQVSSNSIKSVDQTAVRK
jgi:hypothetical protein